MKHTLPQHMPNMEEIQRVHQLKRSLHLPPLRFGMKIKASGVEPEVKINISSILPFLPFSSLVFHSNNHMPLDNGIRMSSH